MKTFIKNNFAPIPVTNGVTQEELWSILDIDNDKSCIIHNWIIWKFGLATKLHRCCAKCGKKQKDKQIIPKYKSRWIDDQTLNV